MTEQRGTYNKNINGTVCVLGIALSALTFNNTPTVDSVANIPKIPMANYRAYNEDICNREIYNNTKVVTDDPYMYMQRQETRLDREIRELFGEMRAATSKETDSVNDYVKNISIDTGVNFFELC